MNLHLNVDGRRVTAVAGNVHDAPEPNRSEVEVKGEGLGFFLFSFFHTAFENLTEGPVLKNHKESPFRPNSCPIGYGEGIVN
jgi:hypothetical protein